MLRAGGWGRSSPSRLPRGEQSRRAAGGDLFEVRKTRVLHFGHWPFNELKYTTLLSQSRGGAASG